MRRRKKMSVDNSIHNEWIATYSDTVTLLLTFFILLYSFSAVDAKKFKDVSRAFQNIMVGSSGTTIFDYSTDNGEDPLEGETSAASVSSQMLDKIKAQEIENQALFKKIKNDINAAGLEANVKVINETKGVVLEFSDSVLFDSGKAQLKKLSLPLMNKVSNIVKDIPNQIVVEGHTDNVPMRNSEFESNWELSCFRAVNVLKYLIEVRNINPVRLSAVGYGEYKPLAKNSNEINKAKNRRVNIMILYKEGEYSSNE